MTAHYHTISPEALQAASRAIPAMGPAPAAAQTAGVVEQFLTQLESLSDAELKKVAEEVGQVMENRKHGQGEGAPMTTSAATRELMG